MQIRMNVETDDLADILTLVEGRIENHTVSKMKETLSEIKQDGFEDRRHTLIKEARRQYGDYDLEIDEDAALSDAETHIWVNAWVCVQTPVEDDELPLSA